MAITSKYTYIYLSLKELGHCRSDISVWVTNNRLRPNANFIIIGTSTKGSKLTLFFLPPILNHSITPSRTVHSFGVTVDGYFNFRKLFLRYVAAASIIFVTLAVFVAVFLFQSLKLLLQHSLLVDLITATLFFKRSHQRIF